MLLLEEYRKRKNNQNAYADFLRKNMVVDVEPEKKDDKTKLPKRKNTKVAKKLEYFMI